jgi:hypothetical protein
LGLKALAELEDGDGSLFATAIDPDGNYVQIIELSDEARAVMETHRRRFMLGETKAFSSLSGGRHHRGQESTCRTADQSF